MGGPKWPAMSDSSGAELNDPAGTDPLASDPEPVLGEAAHRISRNGSRRPVEDQAKTNTAEP